MRLFTTPLPFYALFAWFGAGRAYAAEEAHGTAEHSSGGLPQLDPTWYASQLFWLALVFAALYVIFSKRILPELSKTIESRHERIDGDLEEAQKLKEKAEEVHKAYEDILDAARTKSSDLFATVEEDIKEKSAQAMESFREKSLVQSQSTENLVNKAKKAAMKDMDAVAAEVASQAAEKIVGISTNIDQVKSVIENLNKKAA